MKAEEAWREKKRRREARQSLAKAGPPPKQVNVDHLPHTWTPGRVAAEMEKRKVERRESTIKGIRFSTPPPARPEPTKEELMVFFAQKSKK